MISFGEAVANDFLSGRDHRNDSNRCWRLVFWRWYGLNFLNFIKDDNRCSILFVSTSTGTGQSEVAA